MSKNIKIALIALALAIAGTAHADTPSEDRCRAIARQGETWEDACERVYHVSPDAWDPATGKLRAKHDSKAVAAAKTELATAKAHLKAAKAADRKASKIERAKARVAKDQAKLAEIEHAQ